MHKIEILILNQIRKAIQSDKLRNTDKSTPWTKEIKRALVKLGHQQKCKVSAFPKEELKADDPQWLYDLCWVKESKDWKNDFKGLRLIAEIEWLNDEDDIVKDFLKLTIGVADYRLMIIYYTKEAPKYNEKWANRIIKKCKKISSRKQGFRYLMIKIHNDLAEPVSWMA